MSPDFKQGVHMLSRCIKAKTLVRNVKNTKLDFTKVLCGTGLNLLQQEDLSLLNKYSERVTGEETTLALFRSNVSRAEEKYHLRNLVPANPYTLARLNEDDPMLARRFPTGTFCGWKNGAPQLIVFYVEFDGLTYLPCVSLVQQRIGGVFTTRKMGEGVITIGDIWFAGVRKLAY